MAENDPGAGAGSQGQGQGNGEGGGQQAPQPITINAELLGEFKDDPTFKPFEGKPIGEVLKSFKNAQSMVGAEKIALPAGKLDTPENWQHVFDKLGRPKDVSGYKLTKPQLPDGMPYDEKLEKTFTSACHYLGILPWQAEGLNQVFNGYQAEIFKSMIAESNKQAEVTEAALMKELGTKEKYDEYVKGAEAALKRFGGAPEDIQAFVDKFGNDPLVIKVFGNVAKGMMEDAAIRGDKSFNLLGEDAPAMVKDIMQNKDNKLYAAYWNKSHPQHNYAVAEVSRLQEVIHGNKPINMEG